MHQTIKKVSNDFENLKYNQRFGHLHNRMFRHLAVLFLKGRSGCLLTAVLGKQLLLLCGGQIPGQND